MSDSAIYSPENCLQQLVGRAGTWSRCEWTIWYCFRLGNPSGFIHQQNLQPPWVSIFTFSCSLQCNLLPRHCRQCRWWWCCNFGTITDWFSQSLQVIIIYCLKCYLLHKFILTMKLISEIAFPAWKDTAPVKTIKSKKISASQWRLIF